MDDESSDVELLRRWREGDRASGSALLRRHFGGVFRYFDRHVSGADVEDLTQRTFQSCVESRDRLLDDASFRAYLFGIARKQLLKHYEWKRPRGQEVSPSGAQLRDIRTSPSGLMARADQQQLFVRAMQEVPEEYRVVLDLFFWQDRKMKEIAAQLEVPLGTVKSRLHRGKAMIKDAVEALDVERELRRSTLAELDSRAIEAP